MARAKTLDESLRVGYRNVDAVLDAFCKLESVLDAINRLAEAAHNASTVAGLADIGQKIAHEMADRLDQALLRMACNASELEVHHA
ncbi:hypothetical protein [Paraburkholderia tropica]|uniref:hypothetical protein n=1 Tax=Paraburkholderia tropica TaxID=92647 RepID=UPI0015908C30|nr:hypothetical protein [Paraburkholderia tropica]